MPTVSEPPPTRPDPPELTASPLYLLAVLHSARQTKDVVLEAVTRKRLADLGVKIIFGSELPTPPRRKGDNDV